MQIAKAEDDVAASMLYLASYSLMLRVPSEGLPLVAGAVANQQGIAGAHSSTAVLGNELVVTLARRKNLPHGSTIRRGCTAQE